MYRTFLVSSAWFLGVVSIVPTEEDVSTLLSGKSIITMIVLAFASIPTMMIMIRWVIKYQRDFTAVYAAENDKLRDRVDSLEAEIEVKNDKIVELNKKVGECETRLFLHEVTIMSHENTITHLNDVIDRRKLKRREENGNGPSSDPTSGSPESDH